MFSFPSIRREIQTSLKLGIPLIVSEVIYALNSFFATVMVAHLGKEQLAANALVWNIYLASTIFFIGIFSAVGIVTVQSFGAKDRDGVAISFRQGMIMALISTIPMVLIIGIAPIFLLWSGQDPAVVSFAKPFFYSLILQILPLNVVTVMQQFLIGINRVRIVMFTSILAVPMELFFFYVFLFGKFNFPELGLAGIGYGLAMSYAMLALFLFAYLFLSKEVRGYELFKKWWIVEPRFFFEIFRIGYPLGFMWCSEVLFFAAVAIMMGILGIDVLAAFQIADQYLMIALVVLFALGQTVAIRVGSEVGKNNRHGLALAAIVNVALGVSILGIFSIIYLMFPEWAIKLDVDTSAVKNLAIVAEALKFFPLIAILLLTDCIRIVLNGALRGLKDTGFQLIVSLLGYWFIAFPLGYFLAFRCNLGGSGIWWGIIIGLFINGIMLVLRFIKLLKNVDLLSMVTRK